MTAPAIFYNWLDRAQTGSLELKEETWRGLYDAIAECADIGKVSSDMIATPGLLESAMDAARDGDTIEIRRKATGVLRFLAIAESERLLDKIGLVELMMGIVRDGETTEVKELAVWFFHNLAFPNANRVKLCNTDGFVDLLMKVVRNGETDKMKDDAVGCLWVLAAEGENAVFLFETEGLVELMTDVIRIGATPAMRDDAVGFFASIAQWVIGDIFFSTSQLVPLLIEIINQEENPLMSEMAVLFFKNLATRGHSFLLLNTVGLLPSMLNVIQKAKSPSMRENAVGFFCNMVTTNESERLNLDLETHAIIVNDIFGEVVKFSANVNNSQFNLVYVFVSCLDVLIEARDFNALHGGFLKLLQWLTTSSGTSTVKTMYAVDAKKFLDRIEALPDDNPAFRDLNFMARLMSSRFSKLLEETHGFIFADESPLLTTPLANFKSLPGTLSRFSLRRLVHEVDLSLEYLHDVNTREWDLLEFKTLQESEFDSWSDALKGYQLALDRLQTHASQLGHTFIPMESLSEKQKSLGEDCDLARLELLRIGDLLDGKMEDFNDLVAGKEAVPAKSFETNLRLFLVDLIAADLKELENKWEFVKATRETDNVQVPSRNVVWPALFSPHLETVFVVLPQNDECRLFAEKYRSFSIHAAELKALQEKIDGDLHDLHDSRQKLDAATSDEVMERTISRSRKALDNPFEFFKRAHETLISNVHDKKKPAEFAVQCELQERRESITKCVNRIQELKPDFQNTHRRILNLELSIHDAAVSGDGDNLEALKKEKSIKEHARDLIIREYDDLTMEIKRLSQCRNQTAVCVDSTCDVQCDFPELFFAGERVWETSKRVAKSDMAHDLLTRCNLLLPYDKKRFELAVCPRMEKVASSVKVGILLGTNDGDEKTSHAKVLKRVDDIKRLRRGLLFSRRVHHPSILACDGALIDNREVFLQFPYCAGGNLEQWTQERVRPANRKLDVLAKIASALTALHDAGIIHRDLKPQNVVMSSEDDDAVPLVTDFDSSAEIGAFTQMLATTTVSPLAGMTLSFVAPEVINGTSKASFASDVFALGCTIVAVLCFDCDNAQILTSPNNLYDFHAGFKAKQIELDALLKSFCPSRDVLNIMQRCLVNEVSDRPTAQSLAMQLAKRLCCIGTCGGEFLLQDSAVCPAGTHYLCRLDMNAYVESETKQDLTGRRENNGEIVCATKCSTIAYSLSCLSSVLYPNVFASYVQSLGELQANAAEESTRKVFETKMKTQETLSRIDLEVYFSKQRICNAMSMVTPCCGTAWHLVDGCLAITCPNCTSQKFCGYCDELALPHVDVHSIVCRCPFNPYPGSVYCTDITRFPNVRRDRNAALMGEIERSLSNDQVRAAFRKDRAVVAWRKALGMV